MESLFESIVTAGESILYFAWLPLIIWTLAAMMGWIILRTYTSLHPQIQYHGRLALMFALPAGFLGLFMIQTAETYLFAGAAEPVNLSVITILNPIEIGVTESNTAGIYTFSNFLIAGVFLFVVIGAVISLLRFVMQWLQLLKIKSLFHFIPLTELKELDSKNREQLSMIRNSIKIAFHHEEIVPVTFGYRNPVILLPDSLRNQTEKLNLAIRHELTHISQNDFLSQVTTLCTGIFFWFHPFVHLLKKELIEYRELRCDSMVLSEENISRKEYASLLLELLHMPNLNKELSVNMAQESSNLKKRILMITQPNIHKPIPKRLSLTIFGVIILSTAIFMACTDMQTSQIFDNEELGLMTDVDRDGTRGYHQIVIFLGDEEQAERHMTALQQLNMSEEQHIMSMNVLKDQAAIDKYGERGEYGVLEINTNFSEEAYNSVLETLGMESEDLDLYDPDEKEDYYVVVEQMPELIGGLQSILSQIRYPEMALRAGIEGRVFIQFIVNEEGEVEHPRVIRGIGGGADEEALRVVSQAKFTPGMQRGRPVKVQYSLPIYFRISNSETSNETSTVENPTVVGREMSIQINKLDNGLSGKVLDKETNQPLTGASVIVDGSNRGAVTNMDGNFTITGLDTGDLKINVSYVGYVTARVDL